MATALSKEQSSNVKKLSKKEMKLLINSFIALRHIHRMVKEVEGDISKLTDKEAEKEIKHIWRIL